jgi:hypothetical protein
MPKDTGSETTTNVKEKNKIALQTWPCKVCFE